MKTQAILVVSFGTSYEDTRRKTIDVIEHEVCQHFPDHKIYRAWTSKMIIKKIYQRDGIKIPTVKEAMAQIIDDGITHLIVQPTHVINGVENDVMKEDVLSFSEHFSDIRFGAPLLTCTDDHREVIETIMREFDHIKPDEALVFMGHGTTHYVNSVYAGLDYMFKDLGYKNVFMGTVEAYPELDSVMRQVAELRPSKVYLTPFMIVAGDHATNDLAGDDDESWKNRFEAFGFDVECILKGLGEYEGIRNIFLDHIHQTMQLPAIP